MAKTSKVVKLTKLVQTYNKNLKRKYSQKPYINHLLKVANMAQSNNILYGFEIGLCHDMFEDTEVKEFEIVQALLHDEYSKVEIRYIINSVKELTDVFTSKSFPRIPREGRKKLEAERLWFISPNSQSIKYCDIIDNLSTIELHDEEFAKVYKKEKKYILKHMNLGNQELFKKALKLTV